MIGRSRKDTFKYIKDRVWKKINSWSSRSLSQAGRETLIKSVLQAIPSYIMSIFLLPSSLSDEIEKMMNSFWWGHNRIRGKGLNWLSWDKLSIPKRDGGMGFRNLSAFNYAMLGKQAWSIMTNPDKLVTKLFKARYFPNRVFMDSGIGHNPSYVWRSLWSSKFVIRSGHKGSIGSGDNIPVWGQNWLHDSSSLINPWPNNPVITRLKVADLMSPNSKSWSPDLILPLVGRDVANKILNTPLFEAVHADRMIWKLDGNGNYSVRKTLYPLELDLEIKVLIARIRVVSAVWRKRATITSSSSALKAWSVGKVANQEEQATFSTILWSLWKCRNNLIWNQTEESKYHICNRAMNLLVGWRKAQTTRNPPNPQSNSSADTTWRKPAIGRLKCNIDASFSNNKVGIGACIRDDKGSFIAARTEWFSPITEVAVGEALGLLSSIKWVNELGYDNMDFELDAKSVVDNVNRSSPNNTDCGAITSECKRVLVSSFRNSHVKFVRRQANEVAHVLARAATFFASFQVFTDIPTCILSLIINEMK
ncbi:uncharacterized protein LOC131658475 [Vicia villosa]|uniref:uncharacterized protein LOC131658475 n=1 Tax=Vicia villosa TaxID=3911 RepID=UPI00273B5692|nr:uncharacterized protein LOC131658475 [Vicia villosa]